MPCYQLNIKKRPVDVNRTCVVAKNREESGVTLMHCDTRLIRVQRLVEGGKGTHTWHNLTGCPTLSGEYITSRSRVAMNTPSRMV